MTFNSQNRLKESIVNYVHGLHAPWKSLKIAVGAGKFLNFSANFIQPSKQRKNLG